MNSPSKDAYVIQHLQEVGLVCTQWAMLEWLFEVTHWWLLGLLNKPDEARIITGGLNLITLARRVSELSHLRISDAATRSALVRLKDRINAIKPERDLAVHGVRSIQPGQDVTGTVARGTYKGEPQKLPLIRLSSLNAEIAAILNEMTPLLEGLGILKDNQ